MQISIAMCTYNGARFLREQLQSLAAQTLLPAELVICDDGSTDDTILMIEEFCLEAAFPVHLHRNARNLGSTRNFEQAIQLCTGNAIALCDQDDVWLPRKLETLVSTLESDPDIAGVFSNADLIDENGTEMAVDLWSRALFSPARQQMFAQGDGALALIQRDTVTGCTLLFRRRYVPEVLPIAQGWIHDGWIALILAAKNGLRPVPDRLMRYRLHEAQQVGLQEISFRQRLRSRKEAALQMHRQAASRFTSIADRLSVLGAPARIVAAARARGDFLSQRIALLQESRVRRLFSALVILPSYCKQTSGLVAVLRDLTH